MLSVMSISIDLEVHIAGQTQHEYLKNVVLNSSLSLKCAFEDCNQFIHKFPNSKYEYNGMHAMTTDGATFESNILVSDMELQNNELVRGVLLFACLSLFSVFIESSISAEDLRRAQEQARLIQDKYDQKSNVQRLAGDEAVDDYDDDGNWGQSEEFDVDHRFAAAQFNTTGKREIGTLGSIPK